MIMEVNVVQAICEKCNKGMDRNDKYCYNCGNDLTKNVTYKEILENKVRLKNTGDWRGIL